MPTALVLAGAYCLGSISFAVVVSFLMRLPDPRSYGSKNPGATNVLRSGSKAAALLTLAGDAGKGWLAVWLAGWLAGGAATIAAAGVAVFLGHLFPVFHRFRGGKGVATAAAVLFGFDWRLGLATLVAFALIVAAFRLVSLASMSAALLACGFAWYLGLGPYVIGAIAVMAAMIIWRHKENIGRLIAGNESKLGAKKAG
ncbi:MAG TPA: glycerol-3-phosphate 1-O-acyltransferase PlsY [Burkholderiales bacterium]|nr:glycerol-3-phosphate 1-O-acyltransferase PlsY [Burkholderiales bacterium]